MVVYRRQEQVPGAFLFLSQYLTGLKPGEELPLSSYYPMSVFKSRFRSEKILSLLIFFAVSESIANTDKTRGWYRFIILDGSVYMWC